jgi:Aromatic-ring hydroxylase, C-terminal
VKASDVGLAHPSLLDTYTYERQPVGAGIVKKANDGLRDHLPIWDSLGFFEKSHEDIRKVMSSLNDNTPQGKTRRAAFEKAIARTEYEFHAIGVESNQRYFIDPRSAIAIEEDDRDNMPVFSKDEILYYHPSTFPGCRLPHAWLGTAQPSKLVSTLDLCGKGGFTLLTGIGGSEWRTAAKEVGEKVGFEIRVVTIGPGCDREDVYFKWSRAREVDESGAILVRPDLFVGWRCQTWVPDKGTPRLLLAMRKILGFPRN